MALNSIFSLSKINYLTVGALILQNILTGGMKNKFGAEWKKELDGYVYERAEDEEETRSCFKDMVERSGHGEIVISKIDITACIPLLYHFELLNSNEKELIRRARILRNVACHEIDTDITEQGAAEIDENFWDEGKKLFREMSAAFVISEEAKNLISEYSDPRNFIDDDRLDNPTLFGRANALINSGEEKQGFDILTNLAKERYYEALMYLSEIYRTEKLTCVSFDIEKAADYAYEAFSIGTPNAETIFNKLEELKTVTKRAKASVKDCFALIEEAKHGRYLPNKWSYIYPRYIEAEQLGWDGLNQALLEEAEGVWQIPALQALGERGEFELIINFLAEKEYHKALSILSDILSEKKIGWRTILKAEVAEKYFSENPDFKKEVNKELGDIYKNHKSGDTPSKFFGNACYFLAEDNYKSFDKGTLKDALELDAEGSSAGYSPCIERVEKWYNKYKALTINDENASYLYDAMSALPAELQKEVSDNFWKDRAEFVSGNEESIKKQIRYILNNQRTDENGDPVKFRTIREFREDICTFGENITCNSVYKDKFDNVFNGYVAHIEAEVKDQEKLLREKEIDKRIADYTRYFGEQDRILFWSNDRVFSAYVDALEYKHKYMNDLGVKTWDYWLDTQKVEADIHALKNKKAYEGKIGSKPWEFWGNDSAVNAELKALEYKEKYEKILGNNPMEYWRDTIRVKHDLKPYKNKEWYEDMLGEKEDSFWQDTELVEKEVAILEERKEKYSNLFGERDWEFWRNTEYIQEQIKVCYDRYDKFADMIERSKDDLKFWYDEKNIAPELERIYTTEFGERDKNFWQNTDEVRKMFSKLKAFDENLEEAVKTRAHYKDEFGIVNYADFLEKEKVKNTIKELFGIQMSAGWVYFDEYFLSKYLEVIDTICNNMEMVRYPGWATQIGLSSSRANRKKYEMTACDVNYGDFSNVNGGVKISRINWKFWMDSELVQKEIKGFARFKEYSKFFEEYGQYIFDPLPHSFWYEDSSKFESTKRDAEERKKGREVASKRRERNSKITGVLSTIFKPITVVLKFLAKQFLPEVRYLSDLISSIGLAIAYTLLSLVFTVIGIVTVGLVLVFIFDALLGEIVGSLLALYLVYAVVSCGFLVVIIEIPKDFTSDNLTPIVVECLKLLGLGIVLYLIFGQSIFEGLCGGKELHGDTEILFLLLSFAITQSIASFMLYLKNINNNR